MEGEKRGSDPAGWGPAMWFAGLVPEQRLMEYEPSQGWAPAAPAAPVWVQGRADCQRPHHGLLRALRKVSRFTLTGPNEV